MIQHSDIILLKNGDLSFLDPIKEGYTLLVDQDGNYLSLLVCNTPNNNAESKQYGA